MPNWVLIKKEWETSNITLKDLAEKHGVKLGTLKSRKSREKWSRGATDRVATSKATRSKKVATSENEISWIDIENEYVTDIRKKPCTLKDLAEKYNVSYDYLRRYAAENDWKGKREKHITNTSRKTVEKSAELISDNLAEITARHFMVSDKLLKVIEDALSDENEFYKYVDKLKSGDDLGYRETIEMETLDALNESKLLTVVNAMDKIQKMQRQTLNIFDAKDLVSMEKVKAETELTQQRTKQIKGVQKDTSMLEALIQGRKQYEQMMKERENK
jgi:phage terminase small subunit